MFTVHYVSFTFVTFISSLDGSDTTSHTNTIELYGPTKETQLYPMSQTDETRSYGTNDKYIDDDYSDDYKSYEVRMDAFVLLVLFWSFILSLFLPRF